MGVSGRSGARREPARRLPRTPGCPGCPQRIGRRPGFTPNPPAAAGAVDILDTVDRIQRVKNQADTGILPLTISPFLFSKKEGEMRSWVQDEFEHLDLGDHRLNMRLVNLLEDLSRKPTDSIPQACGNWASTKAAYRFFDDIDADPRKILQSHISSTVERCRGQNVVLCVQDTTYVNQHSHPCTEGLGPIDTENRSLGFIVHSALAVLPDGLALGLLHQKIWARDRTRHGKRHQRRQQPIENKESNKWIETLDHTPELSGETTVFTVCDREADIFDFFIAPRRKNHHLLVRAAWNRKTPEGSLFSDVRQLPAQGEIRLEVPRKNGEAKRLAFLKVRFASISLKPPRNRPDLAGHEPVSMWAVAIDEEHPPEGAAGISWFLLTTSPVETLEHACLMVDYYKCRWVIERYHLTLKSGCRIEGRQLESLARLKRCLALYMVVAWRLLWVMHVARRHPDAPCTIMMTRTQWRLLFKSVHRKSKKRMISRIPTIREVIRWIAQLGGFLARKGDGEPGVISLWRGYSRFNDIVSLHCLDLPASPGLMGNA